MKIVFASNYFNHHQSALSDAFFSISDGEYAFISTRAIGEERIALGYDGSLSPSYVIGPEHKDHAFGVIGESEAIIYGSVPADVAHACSSSGRVRFRYSERPLKRGLEIIKLLPRFLKWHLQQIREGHPYLLCASAFASFDYALLGVYRNRMFKWGYFPPTNRYVNFDCVLDDKNPFEIIWVARFIEWKHPEEAIAMAAKLRDSGYSFRLKMLGLGPMQDKIVRMVKELSLESHVLLLGSMSPGEVRSRMEKSGVFVLTSDRNEGWGAVLNEAMNSGCAVVSSHLVGAAPYLIRNGENGYVYQSGDTDELYRKVKYLLDNPDEQRRVGEAAYKTIAETWNAEVAAERFVNLAQHILDGDEYPNLYEDGPCSRAEIIREDWYKGES